MTERAKADQGGPFKEFVFEEWLRDGLEGICHKMEGKKECFDLSEFRTHMRNAQKERLLAVRSLIDRAIERLEETEEKGQA